MLTLSLHTSLYCRHQVQSRSLKLVQFNGGHYHAKHDYTELHVLTWGIKTTTSPPMTLTKPLSPILAPHYFALWLQVKESQLFYFFSFLADSDRPPGQDGHPELFCHGWTPQTILSQVDIPKLLRHRWTPQTALSQVATPNCSVTGGHPKRLCQG